MSHNSISSEPKIDCDCIFALKSPKMHTYGVLADSMIHLNLSK